MTNHILRRLIGSAAILLLPGAIWAQGPATSFGDLSQELRRGQTLTVTLADGARVRGRMFSVTDTTLVLDPLPKRLFRRPSVTRNVSESEVVSVTRVDSLSNGVILGMAAGYATAATAACVQDGRGDGRCFVGLMLGGPMLGLVGGAIGGLIDARMNQVMYRRSSASGRGPVALVPRFAGNGMSVGLQWQF